MAEIKGLIFDLDGVIVDTATFHFEGWRTIANGLGFDFNEIKNEELKGLSREDSLQKILSWENLVLPATKFEACLKLKNEGYLKHIEHLSSKDVLPGILEFIVDAKELGYKIALGSSSKNAEVVLEKLCLSHLFDARIGGNEVKTSKPNPQVFLAGAEALSVPPENCMVFEDSIAGIEAAKACKMKAIGIGNAEILKKADAVFPNLSGIFIQDVILKLSN